MSLTEDRLSYLQAALREQMQHQRGGQHSHVEELGGYHSSDASSAASSSSSSSSGLLSGSSISSRHRDSPGKIYPNPASFSVKEKLRRPSHATSSSLASSVTSSSAMFVPPPPPVVVSSMQQHYRGREHKSRPPLPSHPAKPPAKPHSVSKDASSAKPTAPHSSHHSKHHQHHHKSSSKTSKASSSYIEDDDLLGPTATMIENERLGYQLVEEVHRTRQALHEEKQKRRVLSVQNETLQEALYQAEQRISYLENSLQLSEQSIQRLERINHDEVSFFFLFLFFFFAI